MPPTRSNFPTISSSQFWGKEGLLRRYNFTVTESTPLNQEVAVDPEMLGKVFETVVLTSEEAENYQAPNLRKATGSYYTPRIVVTFILREALKKRPLCPRPIFAQGKPDPPHGNGCP